jgi:enoyl-[acyl-carrier protein] reductase II
VVSQAFKDVVIKANEGDTQLTLKELTPVRLVKNAFFSMVEQAYERKADKQELQTILGRGRAKKGMFEGDLTEGELEIGQVASLINEIKPASEIIKEILTEFEFALNEQNSAKFTFA